MLVIIIIHNNRFKIANNDENDYYFKLKKEKSCLPSSFTTKI